MVLLKILMILYCMWSNFYQKVEYFLERSPEKIEKYKGINPKEEWENYTKNLHHYGSDKWYMAYDVISRPDRFLARGEGDCDDFARLGYDFFGNKFKHKGENWKFVGIICLIYNNASGHAVAVWRSESSVYMIVSNNYIIYSNTITDYFDMSYENELVYIVFLDIQNEKLKFNKIVPL